MKWFVVLITIITMIGVSGCEIDEHEGGGREHYWHGYGHEEHHWHDEDRY
jgi:hypothetical protein